MRLTGRAEWGGSANEQLSRALDEIHYTFVRTRFKSANKFVEHSFNIFSGDLSGAARARHRPDRGVHRHVGAADHGIPAGRHFTCLNHALMQQLGTIGQAFYMRLFFHFANLYDGHHQKRVMFVKRYDDICAEWLGGLAVRPYLSFIERDQLGPHLRQLVRAEFLGSYAITEAKGRTGFVITFRPGAAFFADYDRFYRRRERGTVQFDFQADRQQVAEPLKVAYLFVEKRSGHRSAGIPYVASKDVDTAKYLLAQIPFEQIPDFLDYALAEAKKTASTSKPWAASNSTWPATKNTAASRPWPRRPPCAAKPRTKPPSSAWIRPLPNERRLTGCSQACRPKSRRQSSPPAHAKAPRFGRGSGSLAQIMFEVERARITVERHPGKIPTLDEWQRRGA